MSENQPNGLYDGAAASAADAKTPQPEVIEWREQLPPGCPLLRAKPLAEGLLLRLVGPGSLSGPDFDSYTALGYACSEDGKECEWSACSMLLPSVTKDRLRSLVKFKRLRGRNAVAVLNVSPTSGHAIIDGTHVNVWMRKSFDPIAATTEIVGIEQYGTA